MRGRRKKRVRDGGEKSERREHSIRRGLSAEVHTVVEQAGCPCPGPNLPKSINKCVG